MKRPFSAELCYHSPMIESGSAQLRDHLLLFRNPELDTLSELESLCRSILKEIESTEGEWDGLSLESSQTSVDVPGGDPQPTWDLKDTEGGEQRFEDRAASKALSRHELIAWYCPAHFHSVEEYGIHFDLGKVVKMGKSISSGNSNIWPKQWVLLALQICAWHEVCHGWAEDLCSLAQTISGEDYYSTARKKYGSYIIMEEALCNTVAYAMTWQQLRLNGRPVCEPDTMIAAAEKWMRTQPPGYKDFIALKQPWVSFSDIFLINVGRLLERIYQIPKSLSEHVIRFFFCHPEQQKHPVRLPRLSSEKHLVHYGYPMHEQ